MLTGKNGILTQAQEAKKATERASIIEQAQVDLLEKQTENSSGDVTSGDLKEVLDSTKLLTQWSKVRVYL